MNTETEKLRQRWPFGLFLAGGTKEPPALFRVTAQSVCRRDVIAQAAGVYREKRENERQMKLVESVKKKRTKKKAA